MVRKSTEKEVENRDLSRLKDDHDFIELNIILRKIKQRFGLSYHDLMEYIDKDPLIPVSIFGKKLGSLESVVKYLRENLNLAFVDIGKLIGRNEKAVWQTFSKAKKKLPGRLAAKNSQFKIPVSIFKNREFSVLENFVLYLKQSYSLRNNDIARLLERDQRTIWTIFNRIKKKS